MDKQKDWTEWIKQLPNWVKGTIGSITLIIGFVVLFQNSPVLSITVSIVVTLISAFCFSVYIAFSKRESRIIEGRHVYRFQSYRGWALAAMFIIPIIAVILLLGRSLIPGIPATLGNKDVNFSSTLPCSISLEIPTTPATPIPDDRLQIESLIKAEADAVVNLDIDKVIVLFREDTDIIDATTQVKYGQDATQ